QRERGHARRGGPHQRPGGGVHVVGGQRVAACLGGPPRQGGAGGGHPGSAQRAGRGRRRGRGRRVPPDQRVAGVEGDVADGDRGGVRGGGDALERPVLGEVVRGREGDPELDLRLEVDVRVVGLAGRLDVLVGARDLHVVGAAGVLE